MRTLLFTLVFLFFSQPIFAVQFLVQAKPHWKDGWSQNRVDNLTPKKRRAYRSRVQIGDIVLVRPNHWVWGNKEKLPNYYVVKVPNMNMVESRKYTRHLRSNVVSVGGSKRMLKKRKYSFPQSILDQADQDGIVTIGSRQLMLDNVRTKTE